MGPRTAVSIALQEGTDLAGTYHLEHQPHFTLPISRFNNNRSLFYAHIIIQCSCSLSGHGGMYVCMLGVGGQQVLSLMKLLPSLLLGSQVTLTVSILVA